MTEPQPSLQLAVCTRCGVPLLDEPRSTETHEEWHAELESRLPPRGQTPPVPPAPRTTGSPTDNGGLDQ